MREQFPRWGFSLSRICHGAPILVPCELVKSRPFPHFRQGYNLKRRTHQHDRGRIAMMETGCLPLTRPLSLIQSFFCAGHVRRKKARTIKVRCLRITGTVDGSTKTQRSRNTPSRCGGSEGESERVLERRCRNSPDGLLLHRSAECDILNRQFLEIRPPGLSEDWKKSAPARACRSRASGTP